MTRPVLSTLLLVLVACAEDLAPERSRWVVVGVDGAEWTVIESLWSEGKLPALRELADRGVASRLATDYGSSPVIWTTVATGVRPEVHGITGFAVPTPSGDAPVSSSLRRAPALWNMLTAARRSVAVVSWWATWPAESIAGPMVSDRAGLAVPDSVSPPDFAATWAEWARRADTRPNPFPGEAAERDHRTAAVAERLAAEDHDLVMAYFRGVDVVSHRAWKGWEPERFPPQDAAAEAALREEVVGVYEATDEAIGRIVRAAGEASNVLVLSDHGFHAQVPEKNRVAIDLDEVLVRLGYQERAPDGSIAWPGTSLYAYEAPPFRQLKKVRCALAGREPGGTLDETACAAARERLSADVAEIAYESGQQALGVRDATGDEREAGADFTVVVSLREPSTRLTRGGEPWEGVEATVSRLNGTHSRRWAGIVFAAGPDVDPAAGLEGFAIQDIAPTVLYGLGLPVGEDFAGRAWLELFTERVRQTRPLRTVESWGRLAAGEPAVSRADEELLEELRALGYIE